MNYSAVLLILVLTFSLTANAQKQKSQSKSKPANNTAASAKIGDEKQEFEKAIALTDASQRIKSLQNFIKNFPQSSEKTRAQELLVSARAQLGDEKLQAGDIKSGVELFKDAVREAPSPMSEKLFADIVLNFPTNLFLRGQRGAAFDIADMIEEKVAGNAKQLLGLATFYIGIESAGSAQRLANKAIEIETAASSDKANLLAAYQALGIAYRLGFQLENAANAYAKALEIDPQSTVSKRSLAEMKRATGKTDEAALIYRQLIENDANDLSAKTGLALSLFDLGKRAEAEAEMKTTLEANANNVLLLVGAAYWYASKNDGAKAIELAQQALKIEPRYTWAYIALARGYMAQNLPLEAEKALLSAKGYGSFPTLDYEIAAARLQSGLYREAAEELKKSFSIKDGTLETKLGGRATVEAEDFIKLLSLERQASIFQPNSASDADTARQLKALLAFSEQINSNGENTQAVLSAADDFVSGEDKMKIHRQLFAASRLLDKKLALPKVLEITQEAVKGVDSALAIPNPSMTVMADQLYEPRNLARSRNEVLLVPEVSRQMLSAILRGRIEEIAGWTLYQQANTADSVIRLKRAISVLPEKSFWWRSSLWRLGTALESEGKSKEAIDNYIKAYASLEQPDPSKYFVIESLYQKLNGSTEGLEQKIGARPAGTPDAIAKVVETSAPVPSSSVPENARQNTAAVQPEIQPAQETKAETPRQTAVEPAPSPAQVNEEKSVVKEEKAEEIVKNEEQTKTEELIKSIEEKVKTEGEKSAAEKVSEPEKVTLIEEKPAPSPEPTATPEISESKNIQNNTEIKENINTKEPEKPEPSPTPEIKEISSNEAERKTLPVPELPAEKISEKSSEPEPEKPSVVVTETIQPLPVKPKVEKTPPKRADSSQAIFDSVVINIPKPENSENPKDEKIPSETPPVQMDEKAAQPTATENKSETKQPDVSKTENSETEQSNKPRVIIEDNLGKAVPEKAENPQCKISVSQENISLTNNRGSLGVLVDAGDTTDEIQAVSSSPLNVSVSREEILTQNSGTKFFVIKSISTKKGTYSITFESACGKKEVQVKVR